jgi:hypothetical protein
MEDVNEEDELEALKVAQKAIDSQFGSVVNTLIKKKSG